MDKKIPTTVSDCMFSSLRYQSYACVLCVVYKDCVMHSIDTVQYKRYHYTWIRLHISRPWQVSMTTEGGGRGLGCSNWTYICCLNHFLIFYNFTHPLVIFVQYINAAWQHGLLVLHGHVNSLLNDCDHNWNISLTDKYIHTYTHTHVYVLTTVIHCFSAFQYTHIFVSVIVLGRF